MLKFRGMYIVYFVGYIQCSVGNKSKRSSQCITEDIYNAVTINSLLLSQFLVCQTHDHFTSIAR